MRVSIVRTMNCTGTRISASTVSQALREYRKASNALADYAASLSSGVRTAAEMFRKMENGVTGTLKNNSTQADENNSQTEDGSTSKKPWFTINDFWKLFGSFNAVTGGIAAIGSLITGGISVKTGIDFAKNMASVTEKTAKAFTESGFDWRTLLGIKSPNSVPKTLLESLGKQIDKYNFGNATSTADKIAVGAKWAGGILTFVKEGYENIIVNEEGNSAGRAIAETVGETAVTIGEGILIGGLVGMVGAPAIVTGALTVGVIWGLDKISEALFDKNIGELVSDAVLDGITYVGEKIGEGIQAIGDGISAAGKAISGWWHSLW